ncbi:MAG: hypothetical protein V8S84_16200 [Lachnospiraceae bacterium]
MISRSEYRGCVKANVLKEDWETALAQTKTLVQEQKEQNKVLTVCLYQHKNMLFLYMETLQEGICPADTSGTISTLYGAVAGGKRINTMGTYVSYLSSQYSR